MRQLRLLAGWGAIAVFPTVLLWSLLNDVLSDPVWAGPTFHVYIVSFASLLALILAVFMRIAAGQLRDPRVLFLSLAFMGIAGIFMTHALTTPGEIVPPNPWVGFSSRLSLSVGAVLLALATVRWSTRARDLIVGRQTLITVLFCVFLVAYGVLAIGTSLAGSSPSGQYAAPATAATTNYGAADDGTALATTSVSQHSDDGVDGPPVSTPFDGLFAFLGQRAVSWFLSALTLALLALVIVRYYQVYRVSRIPLAGGFLMSAIFLAQSQISMTVAPTWHASWWEYHVLMVVALGAAVVGLVREYAQNGSLNGVVGGLLLRDTIVQLQRGYTDVIVALVEAVEAKDPYTRGHTQRVAELSVLIGQDIGYSAEELKVLNQAAMLHDIGKIGIPDSVLNKPGKLTDAEFDLIKEHPARGHRIIQHARSLQREMSGVRHHHERIDGSGYPDGLKGDEIPLDARIIAVADVFDALTSHRPYRAAWSVERALNIIDQEAGSKLDPACAASLHRVIPVWLGHQSSLSFGWQVASGQPDITDRRETPVPISLPEPS